MPAVGRAVVVTVRWGRKAPPGCIPLSEKGVDVYLLYIDESGSVQNPNEDYFVLAGVSVFERQVFHLLEATDNFVRTLGLEDPDAAELHASVMASGKELPWKGEGMMRVRRGEIIKEALRVLSTSHRSIDLFAVAIHKETCKSQLGKDPVEYAYEEICGRFDRNLTTINREHEENHRGLIIMDKTSYEESLQNLAQRFRKIGARWGNFRNLSEVPMFVDSRMSRIIQLADLVAWATWRRYEKKDTGYLDLILSRFVQEEEGGKIHGLVHFKPSGVCYCPTCQSRSV